MAYHPFRFGLVANPTASRAEWVEQARCVEALGYSSLIVGEHIGFGGFAPMLALLSAADATSTLRLATQTLGVDFRNPVLLAQEAATLDLLSDGRLEFGIGAGWLQLDYAATGIPFAPPATRVERLEEAIALVKLLHGDEPVVFQGKHYQAQGASPYPRSVQRPHPPLFIGGGGKRVLSLAGREANIVGLNPRTTPAGQLDGTTATPDATLQKVAWIREAAGERFEQIELHTVINNVIVTDDRRRGVDEFVAWLQGFPPSIATGYDMSFEGILQTPNFLVGTIDQIVEDLQERRERFGISYISVFGDHLHPFSPIVERLAGT